MNTSVAEKQSLETTPLIEVKTAQWNSLASKHLIM